MFLEINKKPLQKIAAIDDSGDSLSYGELLRLSNSFSRLLPGRELVFCLCRNEIGALIGYLSIYMNKSVPLLLGATMNSQSLKNLIEIYSPSYIWAPRDCCNNLSIKTICEIKGYALGMTGKNSPRVYENLSLLLPTSGSTGSAKLVRHKYGNIESNAINVARAFQWTEKERAICHLPMQYTMGLNVINTHLYVGATLLLSSSSLTDSKFWDLVKKNNATNFTGVPYSYEVLSKLRFTRMELPLLRTLSSGGGSLRPELFSEIANYAEDNGKRFFSTFGTTETSARIAFLPPELALEKCGSIGRAIPGGQLSLVGQEGEVIEEPMIEGEIIYRGPNVTMGYAVNRDDLSLGDVFMGEYRTGDIAHMDADGCFYISGRKGRFLKLFGLRVSLNQCENLIRSQFGVDVACLGDDDHMDVFIQGEITVNHVSVFLSKITGLPSRVFNIHRIDRIPRNESGKIMYSNLCGI